MSEKTFVFPSMSQTSERAAQALIIALGAMKKQNDDLTQTNAALKKQNHEMKKYCSSISAIADIVVKMKEDTEATKLCTRDVGDSLIKLWGQLAATGVLHERRQRTARVLREGEQ